LYQTVEQRVQGAAQGRNTPGELPRIAQVLAELRGLPLADLAAATTTNACRVLPKLAAL
jgi:TatD DNase family protein